MSHGFTLYLYPNIGEFIAHIRSEELRGEEALTTTVHKSQRFCFRTLLILVEVQVRTRHVLCGIISHGVLMFWPWHPHHTTDCDALVAFSARAFAQGGTPQEYRDVRSADFRVTC